MKNSVSTQAHTSAHKRTILFLFLLIFGISNGTLMAQSKNANLFTVVDLPKNLTDEQEEMVAKIEKYPNLAKVTYVSIADVNALQRNGFLDFGIPNEPTKTIPRLKLKRLEVTDSDNSFAYGMFVGDFGELMLTKQKGLVFGTMRYDSKSYLIYGIDVHLSAILELNATTANDLKAECNQTHSDEPSTNLVATPPPPTPESIEPCQDNVTTSVLILFTTAANAIDPNINQTAINSVNAYNSILGNSLVSATGTRLRSVGVELLPGFAERAANIAGDVANLSTTAIGRRGATGADIVVLLTRGQYTNAVGRVQQINAEDLNAYAIVETLNAVHPDYNTFSHEVGHLFGGRHQNDLGGPEYSHGQLFNIQTGWWIFTTINKYRTMMGVAVDEYSRRVPYFSNPNSSAYGGLTGQPDVSNVARLIGETTPRISSYQSAPSPFSSNIWGTDYISYAGTYSYEPAITCGCAPYSTVWQVDYSNGTSYSETTTNDTPISIGVFNNNEFITISMTVTSCDGRVSTSFKSIWVDFWSQMLKKPSDSTKPSNFIVSRTANTFSEIFPNPTTSVASFDYNLVEPTHLKVVLIDGLGKTVKTLINEDKQVGYYQHKMEVSDLNAGVYFLQIVSDKQTVTRKILIQH